MNNSRLIGLFKEIGAILRDVWSSDEESGFCCGIRLDSRNRSERMSTPPVAAALGSRGRHG